jgi:HEPN domain-containing protein
MLHEAKAREIRNWLIKASRDLTIAEMNLASEPPITDDAMFHCQQAVEKALKGLLVLHDRTFKKTHIIGEIAKEVLKFHPALEPVLREATGLTPYATLFRYPGEMEIPSLQDAKPALALARSVFQAIFPLIPPEARPAALPEPK